MIGDIYIDKDGCEHMVCRFYLYEDYAQYGYHYAFVNLTTGVLCQDRSSIDELLLDHPLFKRKNK